MFIFGGCGKKEYLVLRDIAYDESKDNPVIYLKENDEYVPYLVLTSDYNGNVLLLREYLLPDLQQYKIHESGWTHHEYGSYYETSSIDKFLNSSFYDTLSEATKGALVESVIEVTDLESYDEWNYKTHMISRKVFLLSAVELGLGDYIEYTSAKEGNPLKYFKDGESSIRTAYLPDGTEWAYWTRTPHLWESFLVTVMGVEILCNITADTCSGVRPAFCMGKETPIKESADVIAGEVVYVLDAEN